MTNLSDSLSVVALIAASGGVVNYATDYIRQFLSARSEARKLAKELEAAALQSNDIAKLGEYLYGNIGATRISNYVSDNVVRERVKQALGGILTFLGPEESEITNEEAEEAAGPIPLTPENYKVGLSQADETMTRALEEIRIGEVWNGLARMRRYIESQLRAFIPDDLTIAKMSLGQLLNLLVSQGRIPAEIATQLRYPIKVANAGIHGTDIDRGQAEEAWVVAMSALTELASSVSPGTDPSTE